MILRGEKVLSPMKVFVVILLLGFTTYETFAQDLLSPECKKLEADMLEALGKYNASDHIPIVTPNVVTLSVYQSANGSMILKTSDNPLTLNGIHPDCQLKATLTSTGITWSQKDK